MIIASKELLVEGQVSSSGEPGWGCEAHAASLSASRQASGYRGKEGLELREGWRGAKILKAALKSLFKKSGKGSKSPTNAIPGAAAATCAAAGSGGSIVLVAEALVFPNPMRSGRITAAGGGCLRTSPGGKGSFSGAASAVSKRRQRPLHEATEIISEECAAGGGGRIAIYAEQPHPLDPLVRVFGRVLPACRLQQCLLHDVAGGSLHATVAQIVLFEVSGLDGARC